MRRFLNEIYGYMTMPMLDAEGGGGGGGEPEPDVKLEMTQDELDALIAKRLGQERKKYGDYDEIKTKLSELETAEAERKKAAMTEAERIQAELTVAKQAAEEAENARKQTLETANQRAIKAEFKLAAAGANIRADALEDAFVLADKAGISVDDGGNVVGVKEALDALIAKKPYLVEQAPVKPRIIGEPNNPKYNGGKTKEQLLSDAAEKAKNSGRIEDLAAFQKLKRELEG